MKKREKRNENMLITIAQPLMGEPCNGCGKCCQIAVCAPGRDLFDLPHKSVPCPLLEESGQCGILTKSALADTYPEEEHERIIAITKQLNGIGNGCGLLSDFSSIQTTPEGAKDIFWWLDGLKEFHADYEVLKDELAAIRTRAVASDAK